MGATVLIGTSAEAFDVEAQRVTGVRLANGATLEADAYVSALPPNAMLDVLPHAMREHPAFAPAASHEWSPIVNLHIWYDRPIGDFDFLAFIDSPVQWVFNRTRIAGGDGPGQYITVSLSGAWEFWPMTKTALRELFLPEIARLFSSENGGENGGAKEAQVERFIVVKEQRATFRSTPGAPANRLPTATPLSNLFLAGDWTETGWPSTMESAVRSGNNAAQAAQAMEAGR